MPCLWAFRVLAQRHMKKFVVQTFTIFMAGLLLAASAQGLLEHEVYAGVAGSLECILTEDRTISRVAMLDTLATDQREIHLLDHAGQVAKAEVANCEFDGSTYECTWGKTMKLQISLGEVYQSNVNRLNPKPFLRGKLKSDIFRPASVVNCPLGIQTRT